MTEAIVNVALPLRCLAGDADPTMHPVARIYDDDGALVTSVPLPHLADGLYGADWTPSVVGRFTSVFTIYTDVGHTVVAGYDREGDEIVVAAAASTSSVVLVQEILGTVIGSRLSRSTDTITMFRGDSRTPVVLVSQVQVVDGAEVESVLDITGATALLTVKRKRTDTDWELQLDGVIAVGTDGRVAFTFAPADTLALEPRRYAYDVELTMADAAVHTVASGVFDLKRDISTPVVP